MRVLVLTDSYPPAATGGYERSCGDVVRRWRRSGNEVLVLTTRAAVGEQDGVLRALTADDASAIGLVLRRFGPDVVSVWNLARVPQRQLLAPVAEAGIPLVIVACDGWLAEADPAVPAAAPGSRIAYVSEDLRQRVAPPPWAPTAVDVVPSGIDSEIFGACGAGDRPWRNRLLYVGRLAPEKGVPDAVDALRRLPEAYSLRIVAADRPQRWRDVRREVCDLGGRVSLASTDRAGLVGEYRAADVLLFPSRWHEPFGLVPLEAMACRTPVVATGTGGSGSYLEHGRNALLVPPADPGAMAAAVVELSGDDRLRAVLVEGGMHTSARYTVDRTAESLAALNRRALADRYTSSTRAARSGQR